MKKSLGLLVIVGALSIAQATPIKDTLKLHEEVMSTMLKKISLLETRNVNQADAIEQLQNRLDVLEGSQDNDEYSSDYEKTFKQFIQSENNTSK